MIVILSQLSVALWKWTITTQRQTRHFWQRQNSGVQTVHHEHQEQQHGSTASLGARNGLPQEHRTTPWPQQCKQPPQQQYHIDSQQVPTHMRPNRSPRFIFLSCNKTYSNNNNSNNKNKIRAGTKLLGTSNHKNHNTNYTKNKKENKNKKGNDNANDSMIPTTERVTLPSSDGHDLSLPRNDNTRLSYHTIWLNKTERWIFLKK